MTNYPNGRRRGNPARDPHALAEAGAVLRERRERLKLSASWLARKIEVSSVHLSSVERGKVGASADLLLAWCAALALPPAEVLCAFRVVPEAAAERFFCPDRMRAALAGGV